MQCFGGLFRPRVPQRDSSSSTGSSGHTLNAAAEASAATGSPASCAIPVQVPLAPAAQDKQDLHTKSAMAMQAFTAMNCTAEPSTSSVASYQPGFKRATHPGDTMIQHEAQEDCGVSPEHLQPLQQEDPGCNKASVRNSDSCQEPAATEGNFSWEPRTQHSKAFLGQRKTDIRGSLDWDFQNELPLVNTRRSKEYGEQVPGFGAGRS